MKYLILSGNPRQTGLCHSLEEEVREGASEGGAHVQLLRITAFEACRVCREGWGSCKRQHVCGHGEKDFNALQTAVGETDMLCLITPVYWGEAAEGLKSFMDKFRRCEFGGSGKLAEKAVLLVASAGETGNGILSCLEQMERFCRHTGAVVFDSVGVNCWNSDYRREMLRQAAKAMAQGRPGGPSAYLTRRNLPAE